MSSIAPHRLCFVPTELHPPQITPPPCPFPSHTSRRPSPHSPHRCNALGKMTRVWESITLLDFPPTTTDTEMISDSVDRVWSLQYVVAGPICGSAGPLSSPPTSTSTSMPYTHGVLFRFGQESPMNAFFAHPRTRDMLASILSAGATSATTITFSSSVPSELEAIFRRGNEWDEGAELIAGLDLQPGSNDDDATEFLSLTQQLATSSAFGAVQASYGPGISVIHHNRVDNDTSTSTTTTTPTTSSAPPTTTSTAIVLLCRFQSKDQLQQFLECPPVAAMFEGDERSPLKVGWSVVIEIAPPENSNTSKSPRGSLT